MRPGTTICIPTWNGAAFVAETLATAAAQDVPGLVVHVSVDGADEATEAACRPFLADPRFRLTVQPGRLGWVGNTNWLIGAVETEFLAILPHDDLATPDWLASLHDVMARHPQAACAFGDVEAFGSKRGVIHQQPVTGPLPDRLVATLLHQRRSVAFRGLVRRRGPDDRPLLPAGLPGDVAADTAWLMELAVRGDLLRVPRVLMRKRYHKASTHDAWTGLPVAARAGAAAAVLVFMLCRALAACDDPSVRARLTAAALLRVTGCAEPLPPLRLMPGQALLAAFAKASPAWRALLPPPATCVMPTQQGEAAIQGAGTRPPLPAHGSAAGAVLVGMMGRTLAACDRLLVRAQSASAAMLRATAAAEALPSPGPMPGQALLASFAEASPAWRRLLPLPPVAELLAGAPGLAAVLHAPATGGRLTVALKDLPEGLDPALEAALTALRDAAAGTPPAAAAS